MSPIEGLTDIELEDGKANLGFAERRGPAVRARHRYLSRNRAFVMGQVRPDICG